MAVKGLKPEVPIADPCSSSCKSSTSPSKFSKVYNKMVLFISKNNSGKEELSCSSLSPPPSITIQQNLASCSASFATSTRMETAKYPHKCCATARGQRVRSSRVSTKEAEEAMRLSDSDSNGELSLEDFAKLVEVEDEHEEDMNLVDAFQMYEMDGRGGITPKSLQRMLRRLGEDRTVEDCIAMIGWFDLNGDGVLNFEEFKIMMQ